MTESVDTKAELDPADEAASSEPSNAAPSEEPASEGASESSEAAASDLAHSADEESSDEQSSDVESSDVESSDARSAGEAPSEGKKKRRRRRRKKGGAPAEAAEAAASAPEPPKKRDPSQLPFSRIFEGAARRHAFSVGEIVAGRVTETREDVAVVDLFGKATAYARLCEPRDIPIAPEPVEEPAEAEESPSAETPSAETQAAEPSAETAEASAHAASDEAVRALDSTQERSLDSTQEAVLEPESEEHELHEDEALHATRASDSEAPEGPPIEPSYVLRPEGQAEHKVGEIMRGRVGAVAESGHIALVNELIDVKATRAILKRARDDRSRVAGLVFGFNRGGFDVLVHGMRAFCPVSGMVIETIDDPHPLLGHWMQFHVQAARSGTQGLVVSRRSIIEKEARKRAKILLKTLEPGQRVKGHVTQVREFGLFVDIGGVEGLVHQSELSWERGVKPEDVAKVGDEIEVEVVKVHERESKRERHDRISLSLRALTPDPWRVEVEQLREGQARKGTVVRTAEFGAFVQLAPGVDGLLHITELGRDLKHADQAVNEGDEIYVVVERIDRKQRRLSLSKLSPEDAELFEKGELAESERAPRLKQGGHVKVRVTQVSPAGLHVQIENVVGKRGRGFIPNSEMGTARGTDHRREWPPGTEIDVKIIGTDRDGGLRCSRKGFLNDEERRAVRDYKKEVGKQGLGTFGDILRQKLGIDQGQR